MSYGVALRNGVPFTLGTIAALCVNATSQWSPLALWPDGILSPGMWISPRDLTSQWQDYQGTTPVATPGTVADASNPVGLALDIRAGAPTTLGPELVVNGDFSDGTTGWTLSAYTTAGTPSGGAVRFSGIAPATNFNVIAYQVVDVTAGTTYRITFPSSIAAGNVSIGLYASGTSGSYLDSVPGTKTVYVAATSASISLTIFAWNGASTDVPFDVTVGPATVKAVPGNHMLQATAAARPLESALVNLVLAKATDPFNSSTDMTGASTSSVSVSFSGGVNTLTRQAGTDSFVYWDKSGLNTFGGLDPTTPVTFTYSVRGVGSAIGRSFALKIVRTAVTTSYVTLTGDWVTVSVAVSPSGNPTVYTYFLLFGESSTANMEVGESVEVKDLQVNYGGPLTYQPVNSTTTYDAAAITPWQLYDGTDDSQATATFAAGTLIDGMDCMIPVRRDSSMGSLAQVVGLYTVDNAKLFGAVQSGGTDPVNYSAGDPDIYVDGYIVYPCTRDTLNTALTVGAWHILEFRNLSLSTWDSLGFGGFIYGRFPGARGDILLFPSTASTEDKDAARQYLADKYGVTLA